MLRETYLTPFNGITFSARTKKAQKKRSRLRDRLNLFFEFNCNIGCDMNVGICV